MRQVSFGPVGLNAVAIEHGRLKRLGYSSGFMERYGGRLNRVANLFVLQHLPFNDIRCISVSSGVGNADSSGQHVTVTSVLSTQNSLVERKFKGNKYG